MDVLDLLGRRLGGAIVIAGALVGIGLYAGSGEDGPKYQAFAADGEVFRVNTESGTIIACNASRCARILQRGQELEDGAGNSLFKAAPAPAALPAPAPAAAPTVQFPAAAPQQALPAPGPSAPAAAAQPKQGQAE